MSFVAYIGLSKRTLG